jgi:cephalosporin-C deacetylase-like acetyl esterase
MYEGCTEMTLPRVFRTVFAILFLTSALATAAPAQTSAEEAARIDNSGRLALNDYLNQLAFDETAKRREVIARITTRAQAEARQREVRTTMLRLMGTLPERVPLNSRTTGSTQREGFRVDKVLFDSQPNFPVTGLLYVPDDAIGAAHNFPAIVMAPGHSPAGKAGDVALASQFAKAGFLVLSYDPIGQGERLQYLDPKSSVAKPASLATRPTGEHGEAGLQPTLIGDALARYFLWDGMRAVDYLQSLPNVDPHRIGAFGCSGGGTMTAMLGALDTRVAAVGVACYTTSWDALLVSATGVQDSEQSTANWIAAGLDFPDWIELAAPRPYAIIATTDDMFPFAGVKTTEAESRGFYKLFKADADLALITGPGGHGNLRPITPQILRFFADHLHPDARYAANLPPITDPFAPTSGPRPAFPPPPAASLTQVTPTGQLASSFSGMATVFTLNQARAGQIATPHPTALADLQRSVREVTRAEAVPAVTPVSVLEAYTREGITDGFLESGSVSLEYRLSANPSGERKHPAVLLLSEDSSTMDFRIEAAGATDHCSYCVAKPALVFAFTPRPSPPGVEETKSPVLGTFYITGVRAQLVGKTLLGMRVDDVIHAVDYLASRPDVDPNNITAEASGHLGLVLLHTAVLDSRLKHITVTGTLASYRALVDTPLPVDAPQDILPGVLRYYDISDIVQLLRSRITFGRYPNRAAADIFLP